MPNEIVTVPDVPAVQVARYAAPSVQITPVTEVISSEPVDSRHYPGHYQQLLLDVRDGRLTFHESTEHLEPWDPTWKAVNDVPRETWKRWHPGKLFSHRGPHMWFEPVPDLLTWVIDSGRFVKELPWLDADAANVLLGRVAPYAQDLLNGLYEAGGELDWSADAARAGRNIGRLCSRYQQTADPQVDADLVDYAEIVTRFPRTYRPELLRLSLTQLADRCESLTRFLGCNERWYPEIKKVYGVPSSDGTCVYLDVMGIRAWYRTLLLNGDPRPLRDFTDWDAEHGRLATSGITSATSDTELNTWIDREENRAAEHGLRLVGTEEAALAYRAQLRERDWDRLAVVGAEVARLERELTEARGQRRALVTSAISWSRSDEGIAERARMSRQAVHKIRTGGKADDTPPDEQ